MSNFVYNSLRSRSATLSNGIFLRVFPPLEGPSRDLGQTNSAEFTVDDDTDVVESEGHGLANGTRLLVSSSGTLPDGLNAGKIYYVIDAAEDTFKLSETSGGSAVSIEDAGTGTHTWQDATRNDQAFGWLRDELVTMKACRLFVDPTSGSFSVANKTPALLYRCDGFDERNWPDYVPSYANADDALPVLPSETGWKVLVPGEVVTLTGKDAWRLRVAASGSVIATVEPLTIGS